jgi:hypothetical protein
MATRTSLRSLTYRVLTGTPDNPTTAAEASGPCSRGASGRVVALHNMQLNDSAYRRARPGFGEDPCEGERRAPRSVATAGGAVADPGASSAPLSRASSRCARFARADDKAVAPRSIGS